METSEITSAGGKQSRAFILSTLGFFCSQGKLSEAEFRLTGSDAYAARFGETIADLGDLDDDGYPGKDLSNTTHLTFYLPTNRT